ncbi:hypothetical protein KVR01_009642 [Diaporthe batatas]|uniref:uncharacterized protein n=1 Tax=Diaporthe batatas TaxID=748121 RepID=UPI001D03716B|nr:uncharacterized protein KVR01_009642 [Diaporthe batatas]KAG8160106.1 hypothetical protein KVR01_009642 [Diaporthe batatas]
MDMSSARTRLRRTFHYPTDESSTGSTPEVLDEEEQEKLIQDLAEQNATNNQQYQIILLALPILSCIPYLLALFRPSTTLIAVLGLTSLASTIFLLFSLPPTETGIHALDSRASSGPGASAHAQGEGEGEGEGYGGGPSSSSGISTLSQRRRRRRRASSFSVAPQKSPLEKHLPLLNVGLCAVLVLYGLLVRRRGDGASEHFGWLGLGNLPAIVYTVVIVAKLLMANVDPERELTALRYDYKGA